MGETSRTEWDKPPTQFEGSLVAEPFFLERGTKMRVTRDELFRGIRNATKTMLGCVKNQAQAIGNVEFAVD